MPPKPVAVIAPLLARMVRSSEATIQRQHWRACDPSRRWSPSGSSAVQSYWVANSDARPPGPLDHPARGQATRVSVAPVRLPAFAANLEHERAGRDHCTGDHVAAGIALILERAFTLPRAIHTLLGASLRSGHAPPRGTHPGAGPPRAVDL